MIVAKIFMKINFTKKQFETLIKMVYMGNWVVNGVRSGAKGDEFIKEYADFEQYIYSFVKDFDLGNLAEYHEKYKEFFPTRELEESEVRDLIDYYDEESFWEELINRLAERDFAREYGAENIIKMSVKERIEKDHRFLGKYYDEIENNGLENLEVK